MFYHIYIYIYIYIHICIYVFICICILIIIVMHIFFVRLESAGGRPPRKTSERLHNIAGFHFNVETRELANIADVCFHVEIRQCTILQALLSFIRVSLPTTCLGVGARGHACARVVRRPMVGEGAPSGGGWS